MQEVYTSKGASLHQINALAEWIRSKVAKVEQGDFDVIRFVEIDLPALFPGLYLEIEADDRMGRSRAYVRPDCLGIVVSETIYEQASNGSISAAETILHEVGHIFLHRQYSYKVLNDASGAYKPQFPNMNASNSAEWQAKMLAFCILFPYSKFRNYKTRIEIQVYTNLSLKEAERLLIHIRKLRNREHECSRNKIVEYVRDVKNQIRINSIQKEWKSDQLSFFHSLRYSEIDACKNSNPRIEAGYSLLSSVN